MNTNHTKKYVYKSTLRNVYGLTPSMIEELEPPDKVVDNPYYFTAPPASLYLIERVEGWIDENKDRVEKARASRLIRSAAAKKYHDKVAAETRASAILWIEGVEINVQPLPDDLVERAKRRFTLPEVIDFGTNKAIRAFVRHGFTNYDDLLNELNQFKQPLSEELYTRLRARVDAIVDHELASWASTAA